MARVAAGKGAVLVTGPAASTTHDRHAAAGLRAGVRRPATVVSSNGHRLEATGHEQ